MYIYFINQIGKERNGLLFPKPRVYLLFVLCIDSTVVASVECFIQGMTVNESGVECSV